MLTNTNFCTSYELSKNIRQQLSHNDVPRECFSMGSSKMNDPRRTSHGANEHVVIWRARRRYMRRSQPKSLSTRDRRGSERLAVCPHACRTGGLRVCVDPITARGLGTGCGRQHRPLQPFWCLHAAGPAATRSTMQQAMQAAHEEAMAAKDVEIQAMKSKHTVTPCFYWLFNIQSGRAARTRIGYVVCCSLVSSWTGVV